MAKKRGKGDDHGGGGGHDAAGGLRWLLTYADLVTLLMVFFSLLAICLSIIVSWFMGIKSLRELVIFLSATVVIVMICVYFSLRISRAKREELATRMLGEMWAIVDRAKSQMVIDNKVLKFIEEGAKEIWVLTKKLENDVHDKDIAEAVLQNLNAGKRYRYFVPEPSTSPAVKRNKQLYEEKYRPFVGGLVTFTYLPEDTLFLFDEIVIYDPSSKERFGYTYMDFAGTGNLEQVVQIAPENVEAIVDTLSKLIAPQEEQVDKLLRMVRALGKKVPFVNEHITFLTEAIMTGSLPIEKRREFEIRVEREGFNRSQMLEVRAVLAEIEKVLASGNLSPLNRA